MKFGETTMADASIPRKKSPRAPTIPLDEAIERVMKAYDKERLHPAPTDVVAQNLGYKGASSGSALAAMASLTKEVEAFKFAPEESLKRSMVIGFLRRPALFAELLEKYSTGLPSDANLRYDLIQRGFLPSTASEVVSVFRRSSDFAKYFDNGGEELSGDQDSSEQDPAPPQITPEVRERTLPSMVQTTLQEVPDDGQHDRIPVRLKGGRRAWLVIPTPFFAADKQRLKAQIDLLLTEDEEAADD
jgi:hypothetical protein